MILPKETKRLKEILGNNYVPELRKVLEANNVRHYTSGYLRQIFNGTSENPEVESCIWKLASIKKQQQIEMNNAKKSILNQ